MPLNAEVAIDLDTVEKVINEPADTTAPPADTIQGAFFKFNDNIDRRRDFFNRTIARPVTGLTPSLGQPVSLGQVGTPVLSSANPADTAARCLGICTGAGAEPVITGTGSLYLNDWSAVLSAGGNLQAGLNYYVGVTPGQLTAIIPPAGNYIIQVGVARDANILDFDIQAPILWRV